MMEPKRRRGRARPRKRVDKTPKVEAKVDWTADALPVEDAPVVDKTEPPEILSEETNRADGPEARMAIGAQIVNVPDLALDVDMTREQRRSFCQRLGNVRANLAYLTHEVELLANWVMKRQKT